MTKDHAPCLGVWLRRDTAHPTISEEHAPNSGHQLRQEKHTRPNITIEKKTISRAREDPDPGHRLRYEENHAHPAHLKMLRCFPSITTYIKVECDSLLLKLPSSTSKKEC